MKAAAASTLDSNLARRRQNVSDRRSLHSLSTKRMLLSVKSAVQRFRGTWATINRARLIKIGWPFCQGAAFSPYDVFSSSSSQGVTLSKSENWAYTCRPVSGDVSYPELERSSLLGATLGLGLSHVIYDRAHALSQMSHEAHSH